MKLAPWRQPLLLVLSALVLAVPARATDPASRPSGPALERLLKLPDSADYVAEKKGGATRSEWRQRFHDARTRVEDAREALAKAQQEIATVVGSKDDWQFTPPGLPGGAGGADSTASFQLRQEVRRQRAELARAEARLRELEVEANLAGLPEDWRGPRASAEPRPGYETVTGSDVTP